MPIITLALQPTQAQRSMQPSRVWQYMQRVRGQPAGAEQSAEPAGAKQYLRRGLWQPGHTAKATHLSHTTAALPVAAVATEAPTTWGELEKLLPASAPGDKPVLTLYRDNNGWCPFCERIMVALREKGIPYEESLINLRDKPKWYTDMVPTKLVPAIKMHDSGELVWESLDIMNFLDKNFPDTRPLMAPNASVSEALARNDKLLSAGFRFAYGNRNASLSDSEKQQRREDFLAVMDELDAALAAEGPFLVGPHLTGADAALIPMMERYRWQLPFTGDLNIYDDRWPAVKRWFDAMDTLPSYRDGAMGDEVSWTLVTSTFLRFFASGSNGTLSDATKATIAKADKAANELLIRAEANAASDAAAAPRDAAIAAASKLIQNHEAVVADAAAGDTESKSQKDLDRLPSTAAPVVDHVLRNAAARLLGLTPEPVAPAEATVAADAARFVAQRLCAPRDMSAPAAKALRAALLQEAAAAR
eukprot:gnl/TRDRNA2_/TRDRNA2_191727_c0_seq1.p1 gnl/TRDRNA2_/TRDRNA2_191727_c0~~gnl/TRDRNA2_/TRDRNA2_191727_c0_seq1.p1  ORF type:complete len:555 (-),score=111.14 gnl/TRDRNA2_/TRDRNA2_191727_c0_seq1:29-1453(-)